MADRLRAAAARALVVLLTGPLPLACAKTRSAPSGDAQQRKGITMTATSSDDLRAIASELNVVFPASAHLLGVTRERGIDDLLEAKVELGAADLPAFMAHSPVKAAVLEPDRLDLLGTDHAWWDPGQAKHLRAAQALVGNGKAFNLGVADGAAGVIVLYLVQHGT
jgi:hypothetical protein